MDGERSNYWTIVTSSTPSVLVNLQKVAESFGGSIELVTTEVFNEYIKEHDETDTYDAPFTDADLAILWKQKKIIYTNVRRPTWPDIIHEMGHIFGCFDHETPCKEKSETSFFGWEYLLVKEIGASIKEWKLGNDNYGVFFEKKHEFGELTEEQMERFIQECIHEGVAKDNIRNDKGNYKILSLRS